jgi:hypothetical protein
VIWKNAERALGGKGDIDSAAPRKDWDHVVSVFRGWASEHSLTPVIVCSHNRTALRLAALERSRRTYFELDVVAQKFFRGRAVFRAEQLTELSQMDTRGFRMARPGLEGVIIFTQTCTLWGGRLNPASTQTETALELMEKDPEGVEMSSRLFGRARKSLLAVIESAIAGEWNHQAMLKVDAWSVAGAVTRPNRLAGRVATRVARKRCPLTLATLQHDRRLPPDVDAWLREVASKHPVLTS